DSSRKGATRMRASAQEAARGGPHEPGLMAYLADLELEVDRLRKQGQFLRHETRDTLGRIRRSCAGAAGGGDASHPLAEIDEAARELAAVLRDLQDPPGYHPAHDQV